MKVCQFAIFWIQIPFLYKFVKINGDNYDNLITRTVPIHCLEKKVNLCTFEHFVLAIGSCVKFERLLKFWTMFVENCRKLSKFGLFLSISVNSDWIVNCFGYLYNSKSEFF